MIPAVNGRYIGEIGVYQLKEHFEVKKGSFEAWCVEAFCTRTNSEMKFIENKADIELIRDKTLAKEGYRIQITESGISIYAAHEIGVIWALTTIASYLDDNRGIKCATLEDAPRYGHRGLLLDCTRHFFKASEVKKVIDEISCVKMNILHWHLADDQGFRIESKKYPQLHSQCKNQYYTQEEIRDIVAFAHIRGVEIIPEIDMPGHTTAILSAYPEYSCSEKIVTLAKTGGIYPIVLCPGKDDTYIFLKELLGEICSLFPSKWFHIGGDEAPDTEWKKCECCQRKMKENKLVDTRQLQGYFSNNVKAILKEYHKDIICWNDSLEAANFKWEDETIGESEEVQKTCVQYWSIQYADSMQDCIKKGGQFIYSDMFDIYLDYPCSMTSLDKVYNCIPMIRETDYTKSENLAGMECCLWTEHVSTSRQLEERLFPRVYAIAENAWSGIGDAEEFKERLKVYIAEVKERGICSLSIDEANPTGETRKKEIMEYTAMMQDAMPEEIRKVTIEFTRPNKEFSDRFMQKFFGA